MGTELWVGLGGMAAIITALVGAFIALSKRRPETASVFIRSAESLVVSQSTVLKETVEQYEAMRTRVESLEEKQRENEHLRRVAKVEAEELHQELATLHEEVAALTKSRDEAREDLATARGEVSRLRERVRILEERLRQEGVPIPSEE